MEQEKALKLYVILARAYRSLTQADKQDMRGHGFGTSEFMVLEVLYHRGPQAIQQLASKVLLTSGSMTYVVTKLENKKLLRKVVDEQDKRIYYAELTEQGTELMHSVIPRHNKFIQEMLAVLTEEEAEMLMKLLKKLGKSVENYEQEV
ncbi:MAG: MarR family winged helix-turn-helix transcriptional regulator [Lachnospiraceae bacterium]